MLQWYLRKRFGTYTVIEAAERAYREARTSSDRQPTGPSVGTLCSFENGMSTERLRRYHRIHVSTVQYVAYFWAPVWKIT